MIGFSFVETSGMFVLMRFGKLGIAKPKAVAVEGPQNTASSSYHKTKSADGIELHRREKDALKCVHVS